MSQVRRVVPLVVWSGLAALVVGLSLRTTPPLLSILPRTAARSMPWLLLAASGFGMLRGGRAMSWAALVAALGYSGSMAAVSPLVSATSRGTGLYLSALFLPAVVWSVVLCFDTPPRMVWPRRAVLGAWGAVAGLAIARAAFYDPFLDPQCWRFCAHNPLVLRALPETAQGLGMVVEAVGAVAVTGLLFAIVSRSWRRRRWYTMIEISGVVVIVGEVLGLVAIGRSLEGLYRFAAALVAIAGVVLALSLTVPGAMAYRAMRRVQRFTVLLDGAATDIPFEVALAGTLSDPGLRVGYPLGSGGPLVDHEGDVIEFAGSDRVSTALRVNDAIVAVVHHDAALSRGNVERQLGRQARMIAWNEGITAALRHRICELQASSRRTVQISDEERQRIERDLHDGAQQRLLALAFGLRRARQTASSPEAGASFDAALVDVKAALRELRELAQGIFPAILAESGLAAALQSLAERAAHPVVIDVAMDDMPLAASRTAYAVAQEAIQNASTPASITVTVRRIGTELVLSINGTAAELSTAVTDRVRAVGGRTHLDAASWRVIVPCAS